MMGVTGVKGEGTDLGHVVSRQQQQPEQQQWQCFEHVGDLAAVCLGLSALIPQERALQCAILRFFPQVQARMRSENFTESFAHHALHLPSRALTRRKQALRALQIQPTRPLPLPLAAARTNSSSSRGSNSRSGTPSPRRRDGGGGGAASAGAVSPEQASVGVSTADTTEAVAKAVLLLSKTDNGDGNVAGEEGHGQAGQGDQGQVTEAVGDTERAAAAAAEGPFKKGDMVVVRRGLGLAYSAEVLEVDGDTAAAGGVCRYKVHFAGWGRAYDCWVAKTQVIGLCSSPGVAAAQSELNALWTEEQLRRGKLESPSLLPWLRASASMDKEGRARGSRPHPVFVVEEVLADVALAARAGLLSLEAALPQGALVYGQTRWSPDMTQVWLKQVYNADSALSLMEACVLLESCINPQWLRSRAKAFTQTVLPGYCHALRNASYNAVCFRVWVLDRTLQYDRVSSVNKSHKKRGEGGGGMNSTERKSHKKRTYPKTKTFYSAAASSSSSPRPPPPPPSCSPPPPLSAATAAAGAGAGMVATATAGGAAKGRGSPALPAGRKLTKTKCKTKKT